MARLSLQARQTAGLVMTAELQQAIGLLQLSNHELLAELSLLAEANPLLLVSPPAGESDGTEPDTMAHPDWRDSDLPGDLEPDASDWRDAASWDDDPILRHGVYDSDEPTSREPSAPAPTRLEQFLWQINKAFTQPAERHIALTLLDAMDESGRLDTPISDLAALTGAALESIEQVRNTMLLFEPAGCFATSLAECLAAQFKARNRHDPAVATLLGHLDWLARGEHERLQKACGLDSQDYAELLQELRVCDPRPGAGFDPPPPEPAPDLFIHLVEGEPIVALNEATWPGLTIDERLYRRLQTADREARGWAQEKKQEAQNLLRAVEQRARSLLLICTAIARHQILFLHDGIDALRPLTLARIAEVTGLHESTVSRVTATRMIGTPHGVIPLRRFFSTGLGDETDQTSAEAIKNRIRQFVSAETAEAILSDEAITLMLQQGGIAIQRRTVAKYREALGIAGSAQRRRDFRMKARMAS